MPCLYDLSPTSTLRCSGVRISGIRHIEPHEAPVGEFGHNQYAHNRGARCAQKLCRACMRAHTRLRREARRAAREGLTDTEIRRRSPERRCSTCREVKPSTAFSVSRTEPDGLANVCKPCRADWIARRRAR